MEDHSALADDPVWGVWCVEDGAWAGDGPLLKFHEAVEEKAHWESGERAGNPPGAYHYQARVKVVEIVRRWKDAGGRP